MSKITHASLVKPIMDDGFIHLGNGDVIRPEVFAKALAENRLVEKGTVVIDHQKHEVRWIHHMTEALAKAVEELSGSTKGLSMGVTVEQSFLDPQLLNTGDAEKA